MKESNNNKKPTMKFIHNGIEIAVWSNEIILEDGTNTLVNSFTIQKNILRKDGTWKSTKNFDSKDLTKIVALLLSVNDTINIRKELNNSF